MASDSMKALVLNAEGRTATVQAIPRSRPEAGEVLVRVEAIALNPVDSLYVFYLGDTGRTVGSDFSGVIVESDTSELPVGQRVAGFLQGACSINYRPGAFAEFLVCPSDLLWAVPDSLTAEEAATMNLCALTAAQGIYYRLGLRPPFPWDGSGPSSTAESFTFFIYGASTSVGMYAAQLVRRSAEASGTTVKLIGAASKGKFGMLRAEPYGYDVLVDYRESDWPQQVRTSAGVDGVHYAYDSISEGSTVALVSSTLREDGKMAIVRSKEGGAFQSQGLTVEPIYGAVWEAFGVEVQYQNLVVSASPEARRFAAAFYRWLSGKATLVANPTRIMPGGLERVVPDGFALLGSGSMHDRSQNGDQPWMNPSVQRSLSIGYIIDSQNRQQDYR